MDVIGFSMGCGTTARLLMLHPPQVKSAVLTGVGDYVIHDTEMEFPKSWPIPDSVPRPITGRVWAGEGAKILERGEIIPGHLASASLIAARVTGADPKVLAAVIRGAVSPMWPAEPLRTIDVPVLLLNGKSDLANQKVARLLEEIPTARFAACEGDHHSTPYEPSFHKAVVGFFQGAMASPRRLVDSVRSCAAQATRWPPCGILKGQDLSPTMTATRASRRS